jgi:hypothetical protein
VTNVWQIGKNVLSFVVLVLVYSIIFFTIGTVLAFIQVAFGHENPFLAQIAGHGSGVFAGVMAAAGVLNNRFFAGYPARTFAVIFIAFTSILLALTLVGLVWKAADASINDSIGPSSRIIEASGSVVAIATCWWVFWKNRGETRTSMPATRPTR